MIMAGQSGDLCLSKIIHLNNNFKLIEEATLTCIKRMTDIIVCNSLATVVGLAVARRLKLPFMGCYTTPETPTKAWPYMPHGGGKGSFGWSNYLSYSVALRAQWMALRKTVCEWHQKRVGVQRIDDGARNLALLHHQDFPVLHSFSPLILGKPQDWGRWIHPAGFWVPPTPTGWSAPDNVTRFLAAGNPPVFVGFGSMGNADEEGLAAVALEAARLTGVRMVLQSEWEGFRGASAKMPRLHHKKRVCGVVTGGVKLDSGAGPVLPSNVLVVSRDVPAQWLVPRCALAVHSGSTLWTGLTLKAGVPSLVCPFVGEQRFWSAHLETLGVAHAAVPVEALTPDALASAMTGALANTGLRTRAKEVVELLAKDRGVTSAVDIVSRFMQRPWDRTAMQILPRREGDMEMEEGKLMRSWQRYKFVLKDHSLEFHRYLPTGLHDPQVLGTVVVAGAEVTEDADDGGERFGLWIKEADTGGGKGAKYHLAAVSGRERGAWAAAMRDVADSWEVPQGTEIGWSTGMASRVRDADTDAHGAIVTQATKAVSIDSLTSSSRAGGAHKGPA